MSNISKIKNEHGVFSDLFVLFCLLFSAIASLSSDKLNSYALYAVLPLAFVISFLQSKRLFVNKYLKCLIFFYVWEAISLVWATYQDASIRELHAILGAFIVSYIVSVQVKRGNVILWLYLVYFVLLIRAWLYASDNLLIVTDFSANERLNDAKLNANTLAYYTTYVTFGAFIINQIIHSKRLKFVFDAIFFAMIPITIFTALTTASRQVLIIQIPSVVLLLWIRFFKQSKAYQKILLFITVVALLAYSFPKIETVYEGSYLAQRSEVSVREDSRSALAKEAMMVGLQHFPLGVGAGNYIRYSKTHRFSHNSYTELFANVGIIGLIIYLVLVLGFIRAQWKRYKTTKDKIFAYFLIFGIIYSIDQFFYVFYIDQWLISFFVLVASHSELYYNTRANKYQV